MILIDPIHERRYLPRHHPPQTAYCRPVVTIKRYCHSKKPKSFTTSHFVSLTGFLQEVIGQSIK